MMEATQQAALRPSAASLYPFLPARMWTAADRLARLVAKYRGLPARTLEQAPWILPEAHFMFRDKDLATNP